MSGKFLRIICFFSLFILEAFATPPPSRVVLVTGGAGYIGSHACKALKEAGFIPVTYDSLVLGEKEAVQWGPLVQGDLLDTEALDRVFNQYKPEAVFHFAALCNVGESMRDPASYYVNNILGSINLLNSMVKHKVQYIIFSSSCTVYGNCPASYVSEESPQVPISPYGVSKQVVERMIRDYAHAYPLKYIILRYFNVAGIETGLKRSIHSGNFLIPRAIEALFDPEKPLQIFGSNYATKDGTGIRDYIHVKDLVRAHVMAFQHLLEEGMSNDFNLGTGKGYSVLEVMQMVEAVTGWKVPHEVKPPREGDAAQVIAQVTKAREILGFVPIDSDLQTMVQSEWDSKHKMPEAGL